MASEARATAGPWRKGRDDMTNCTEERGPLEQWAKDVYSDAKHTYHHVTGTKLPVIVLTAYGETPEEAHANALLAASAPEVEALLDRCHELLCQMKDHEERDPHGGLSVADWSKELQALRLDLDAERRTRGS